MRALLITDSLPDAPRGGLDLHVAELAEELGRRGVTVELHPLADSPDPVGPPTWPGSAFLRSVANNPRLDSLEDLVRTVKPDVVHFHNLQGLSHRMPALVRKFGAQVVWTHHDFFALCQRVHLHDGDGQPCDGPRGGVACGPCFGGPRGILATPVFGLRVAGFFAALRATHAHVAPSRFVRDVLVAEGIPEHRVHVLPPALPRVRRPATPPASGVPRLVFAGDLREAKGADLVIEAFSRLPAGAARLEVFGGPPAPPAPREEDFEARLQALAEGHDVTFGGRFEAAELAGRLDGAAALIVASRVRETFGRTANEALQLGIPVVAPAAGALPEFVREGVNGALFEPGDIDSLAAALGRITRDGLLMQSEAASWPPAPDLAGHVDGLLPLYEWSP